MLLTNLERVKRRLQISSDDTSQDDILNELIIEAEALVEAYCKRTFSVNQYTENHTIMHKIFPHNYPIISVDTIERYDINLTSTDQYTPAFTTDYKVIGNYIELLDPVFLDITEKLQYFNKEKSSVKITYTAGYDESSIPGDLQVAGTLVVVYLFNRLGTEGMSNEKVGDYQAQYTELPELVCKMLNKYRKVTV